MNDKNGITLQLKYGFGSGYKKNLASGRSISQIISGKKGMFDVKDVATGNRDPDDVFKDQEIPTKIPRNRKGKSLPPAQTNTENEPNFFMNEDSSSVMISEGTSGDNNQTVPLAS